MGLQYLFAPATICIILDIHYHSCLHWVLVNIPQEGPEINHIVHRFTISSTRFPVIIVPYAHTLESINKLVVIFLIFEDILVIYASHHHMATFGAASTVPCSLEHCQVVTKVNKVNIPVLDSFLACLGMLYVYRVNLF